MMKAEMKLKILLGALILSIGCSSSAPKKSADSKDLDQAAAEPSDKVKVDENGTPLDEQSPKDPQANRAITPPPGASNEQYQKFNSARASKNWRASAEAAGEILARNPNDYKVVNALAVLAIDQERYDLARLLIGKILEKDPNNSAALNNLGIVEMKQDNLRLALIQFKKASEVDPHNRAAHANLGMIYLQYRNYPNAAAELDSAVADGDQSPATLSNYGFAMVGVGDYAKAQAAYEKAVAKDPSNIPIMLNYASLLVQHTADKKTAIKMLNKIRFVAHEPAILNKVEALLRQAEGSPAKSTTGKGDLE